MERRIRQFVMVVGIGAMGIMSGASIADGATPLLASSCLDDQAFYVAAPTWPGDPAFATAKPTVLPDPGFFATPQATSTCAPAGNPPIEVPISTP